MTHEHAPRAVAAPTSEPCALQADISSFAFGEMPVLTGISLRASAGEFLSFLGPSGCGKSTLIGVLAGLLPRPGRNNYSGFVRLFGMPPKEYRSKGRLSVMFQDSTLLPHLTVAENVELPLRFLRMDRQGGADELLRLVGLERFRDFLPRDLSGGMRTRVALARSFVSRPELLFLDEPFTGLDLGWRESLYDSLQDLRARFGTTVVMVTHDLEEAVYNSDRILVMGMRGSLIQEHVVRGDFPRPYRFGDTVAIHTEVLRQLAETLTSEHVETRA